MSRLISKDDHIMRKQDGITRIDLVVALTCLVFILVNVQIITAAGRYRAKREVCLVNLRMLSAAWAMYADDNQGKIPPGDVYYSWSFVAGIGGPQLAWHEWPHPFPHTMPPSISTNQTAAYGYMIPEPVKENWYHAIAEGTLWKYVKDYKIYQCPVGDKNQYVTYAMSHSMNTWRMLSPPTQSGDSGTIAHSISNRAQITRPAERFVFLDTGYAKQGAFFVSRNSSGGSGCSGMWWGDPPPMRHEQGTTFSFADGHAQYRKWTDPITVALGQHGSWGNCSGYTTAQRYCDCDLRWMVKVTWGDVPYPCTDPNKNCPD
jgi:prepilin-type processing-associated H-X9-DG protein